ncbi:MAG: hypothetical protein KBS41_02135 [Oscillospiraceae bacterium]|nr:hypothetical protein [Candidatus Equicaccousia limihippi]
MIKWLPYTQKYYGQVVDCLKRNFDSLNAMSDKTLSQWMDNLTNYPWIHNADIEALEWKSGVVLTDDEKVVGYLGLIYSVQNICEKKRTVVNPTTWAIDEKYRLTVLDAIKRTDLTADITYNITPIDNMQKILSSVFHYTVFDDKTYVFNYNRFIKAEKIKWQWVDFTTPDLQDDIKQKLSDHQNYPIKCACFEADGQKAYIFYKVRKGKRKKILPFTHITVLETDNTEFFGNYAKEVITSLQVAEKASLISDGRFFNGENNYTKKADKIIPAHRMKISKDGLEYNGESFLYSEIAILH